MRTRQKFDTSPSMTFGPDSIDVEARSVRVDDTMCAALVVTGFPREVRPGWLAPLLDYGAAIDVSVHVEPMAPVVAADRLRRQQARLESSRRLDANHGRLADPTIEVAASDAHALADRLARGEARLFRVGIVVSVRAQNEQALADEIAQVRAILGSLLADVRPTTFRALQGWISTLPLGIDRIGFRRTFDTPALAATYPFPPAELSDPNGVLYGKVAGGAGLVFWDRFAQDNYNSVILARSGSGKSYLAKLEVLRSLYSGIDVAVVDPEDEYARLAREVDGAYLHLGESGLCLNPFDLGNDVDALTRQALFLHSLIAVLVGQIDAPTKAALDRAILAAYADKGITADVRTHGRHAPVFADLSAALRKEVAGQLLADRLAPFVTGTHSGLFNSPTTVRPEGHLVVFSLRDIPEELKGAATMVVLDRIWQTVTNAKERKRRLVAVDEAWLLMRDPAGAKFLYRLAKSARKYWCGLTVITQDAADLLGSELGQAIVANAATQMLLRQSPQAIDKLSAAFRLSEGERSYLLSASRGQAIIAAGSQRVAFEVVASEAEHKLVTSDPAELLAMEGE